MKTETQIRFENAIKEMQDKVNSTGLTISDANKMIELSSNLLIRYEQIRESRDKWKKKYQLLKNNEKIKKN